MSKHRAVERRVTRSIGRIHALATLTAAGLFWTSAVAALPPAPPSRPSATATTSPQAQLLLAWVIANNDNAGLPFALVDKPRAMVLTFDPQGRLVGSAPALLGLALGDRSPPGIGDRKLAAISPRERITPAGRFAAVLGRDLAGKDVLWIDYDAAIALHAVITTNPAEHRLERLASPSVADNRISFGCINVPEDFFSTVVSPLFNAGGGIVYILPDGGSVDATFFGKAQPSRP